MRRDFDNLNPASQGVFLAMACLAIACKFVAIVAALAVLVWLAADVEAQCASGQCPTQAQVSTFGRARVWSDGSMVLRGGLGGASVSRLPTAPIQQTSAVVPVFVGSDSKPTAGVYVGQIAGYGVTLTCWHAARHGVRTVAGKPSEDLHKDKFGYDMVAVLTRHPLASRTAPPESPSCVATPICISPHCCPCSGEQ